MTSDDMACGGHSTGMHVVGGVPCNSRTQFESFCGLMLAMEVASSCMCYVYTALIGERACFKASKVMRHAEPGDGGVVGGNRLRMMTAVTATDNACNLQSLVWNAS